MRHATLICSAALLVLPGVAASQTPAVAPPCLSPREFSALSAYALPSVISGTSRACATTLPEGAYLRRSGDELAQRYAVGKPKVWPDAKAAFIKMASSKDANAAQIFALMPDQTLQQVADAAFTGIVTAQIKPGSCQTIDRVVSLLSPLPPENTAELIGLAVGLGSKAGQSRFGAMSICKV